jgi:hypothetical protein
VAPRGDPGRRRALDLSALIAFAAAFGFVEAAVVYDLRTLIGSPRSYSFGHYHTLLNLGFITFVSSLHSLLPPAVERVEVARESATMVMLLAVAWLAGRTARQRVGAYFIAFSVWDLTYYLYLRLIDGWPTSLFTRDVFFLVPVPWIGPVITPLIIFLVVLVIGVRLYRAR